MNLLSIETSCDETAAAVLRDGKELLSNVIVSQTDLHASYGGVVPELACRRHIEVISPVVERALKQADVTLDEIHGVAVTVGPGLIGALLVGVSFAKGISYALKIPLMAVNHLEGHLWAVSLKEEVTPPFIALVVSGGHTMICAVEGFGQYELLGSTLDDAAGEVFDKVARILGLGFPGGPGIEKNARTGDPSRFSLPRGLKTKASYDFSFSGLKTAVIRHVRDAYPASSFHEPLDLVTLHAEEGRQFKADLAASFQEAVVESLVTKTLSAAIDRRIPKIVLSGGVACNQVLRSRLQESSRQKGIQTCLPDPIFCTDNAAMIAWVGHQLYQRGRFASLDHNPKARFSLFKA